MSSSTSSSDATTRDGRHHRAFVAWVLAANSLAWIICALVPWGGVLISQESHRRVGIAVASELDFLVVGDSKAGPFSTNCLMPWLPPFRGAVFSADSVTPVFHLQTIRAIRDKNPEFAPPVVFVMVGANNLNSNGLHASRDFAYFVQLPLGDAYRFAVPNGAPLHFIEAVFSRLLPVYGQRVNITHFYVGSRGAARCEDPGEKSFDLVSGLRFPPALRNDILDENYLDIYRRSMYSDYRTSVVELAALEALLEMVNEWGGRPILVLPPVTSEMRDLEHRMIGNAFDESIHSLANRLKLESLDLRDVHDYEFEDVNHLSRRGAYDVSRAYFWPVLQRLRPGSTGARALDEASLTSSSPPTSGE